MSVANSLKKATKAAYALPLVFMIAANANADPSTQLERGCRDKDQISKELEADNQGTLVKFFIDGRERGAKNPDWTEEFYTANVNTGSGYRLQRSDNNQICVMATTTNTKIFNNSTFDQKAFLDAPEATKKGSGINNVIYGRSQLNGLNPMFRVVEHDSYLEITNIKYLLGNPDPKSGEGALVAATLDGQYVSKYSKGIPSAKEAPHGAEYTKYGSTLLGTVDSNTKVSSP